MNIAPKVNTSEIKCSKEYVCWIDIMGTKNTMSESFQKAANFILKFHSSVIDIVKDEEGVSCYPLMDGIFITTPNNATIRKIIDKIFSTVGIIFLNEKKYGHRFIIKGSISCGDIAHGKSIDEKICEKLANENDYKRSIMYGLPMIQAFTAEHTAPPFGVYIHESARNPAHLQGKYYGWTALLGLDKTKLLECIVSYFNWCEYYSHYLEIDKVKINLYKELAQEFFSNRMAKDEDDNPWHKH